MPSEFVPSFSQSFSNADLVDEEPVPVERDGSTPQWKCYAKYISPQQILLTFLPDTFTGRPGVLYPLLLSGNWFSHR